MAVNLTWSISCNLLILLVLYFGFLTGSHETTKCGKLKYNNAVKTVIALNGYQSGISSGFIWVLSIIKKKEKTAKDETNENICKGLLIHPQVVVTTAHCVEKYFPENIEVQTGGWIPEQVISEITDRNPPIISQQVRNVSKISLHKYYNSHKFLKNHALLLLSESFDVKKPDVGVICLSNSENFSLECEDYSAEFHSDGSGRFFIEYHGEFRMCPMDWKSPDKFYYSGLVKNIKVSLPLTIKRRNSYDRFNSNYNIAWVHSFLYTNNVNDTDYEI